MRCIGACLAVILLLAGLPHLAASQSVDRIEAAKKEGQLVFFSGMIVQDTQALLGAFEKRFPFIKASHYRARGSALVARSKLPRKNPDSRDPQFS